ncbi:MAG: glycoside hydrolase family 127 protein, partial [Saprospiraceae bacterium]|nr:glycoside hydrolase family 127 protein [Saprospiraceae bacterium]
EADGKFTFNRGACTRQGWFDCSCCPTNMIRFLPAMPGLIYSQSAETIYVNLYASSSAEIGLAGSDFTISQKTDYPWDGKITVTLQPEKATEATLKFRIPSWVRKEPMPGGLYNYRSKRILVPTIYVNGKMVEARGMDHYFTVKRTWEKGDLVELNFPMPVQMVVADERLKDDIGKVALERGPLVYAIEEVDNKANFDEIKIAPTDKFEVKNEPNLLGGVVTLSNKKIKAIPYNAWSNRGVGKMKVWVPMEGK